MSSADFISIRELSYFLGLTVQQMAQLTREGGIPAIRDGKSWCFPRGDVERWLAGSERHVQSVDKSCGNVGAPAFSVSCSEELDHYRAQPGNWNVQVNQLSRGQFYSRIRSIQLPGMTVYDNRWGAASLVQGQSPDGWLMLGGVVATERANVYWCGKQIHRGHFACTAEGKAIEFSVKEHAHDIVLLISPDLLRQAAGSAALEYLQHCQHLDFGLAGGSQFLDVALDMINRCESEPLLLQLPGITTRVQSMLLRALEECFSGLLPDTSVDSPNLREQAVHAAILHVADSVNHISAWDVAQAAGVSQKTLEVAFSHVLGMTPGKYLKLNRLNRAHHELADGGDELTVTRVATAGGFSHVGRFSAEYRRLFGELPSQTLNRPVQHA